MDTYLNFKAFQAVVRVGSFSAASRELGLAASVVTKRVNQLEHQLGAKLFRRSTRQLVLTEAGHRYLHRSRALIAEFDDLLKGSSRSPGQVEDFLRIKAPTSLSVLHLHKVFDAYQAEFPKVRLEIMLLDRSVDPILEGFDLSIGAHWSQTFTGVYEKALCPLRRLLCASPGYLSRRGVPGHPRDLLNHDTLTFIPTGNAWVFDGQHGAITVDVKPRLTSNDGQMLIGAAVHDGGVVLASAYMAQAFIKSGQLVPLLTDFPVPDLWIKAICPERRASSVAVRALLQRLEAFLSPLPPWERGAELNRGR
jgi:DNA-binding transcriptional LysR family regulator